LRPIYLISKTPYEGVIHIPILTIRFLSPDINFSDYEGVVFTSKQGVLSLQSYSFDWNRLKCICVSESTAKNAREAGAIDVEIGDGYGDSIPDILGAKKRRGKWLYLRPKVVASDWVESARNRGITIDEAIVYESVCNEEMSNFPVSQEGVLIFTSPSAIRCFLLNHKILPTHDVIVIGETTKNALPAGMLSYLSEAASIEATVNLARQIAIKSKNSSPF